MAEFVAKKKSVLLMLPLRPRKKAHLFSVPDLGLLYLATALKAAYGDTLAIDVLIRYAETGPGEFDRFLLEKRFDIIGIKVFSANFREAQITTDRIKKCLPQAMVIIGGPHVNAMPANALEQFDADCAIHGDGEEGLVKLVEGIFAGDLSEEFLSGVPGLIWRKNSELKMNAKAMLLDLDKYGIPFWSVMPPVNFPRYETRNCREYPSAPISISRGCSFRCIFCSEAHSFYRKRRINSIIGEIEYLKQVHGVREFQILDDNCAFDKEFFRAFCKTLIDRKIYMPWRIPGGVCLNSLDRDLCELMKKSGCYEIWVGIESGSDELLRKMNKGLTVSRIRERVEMIRNAKLHLGGFFILGFPGECKKDRNETLQLALSLPLNYVKFTIFIPQPGSEMFNRILDRKMIEDGCEILNCGDNQYENRFTDLSPRELKRVHLEFSLRFYLRPKIILALLKEYNSIPRMIYLLKSVRRFVLTY